ncbi:PD-(D/E)XK nuclease family protein [Loigolactobacillus zhaoyuanensis]|uniref:ATP-dependent helicase/deoxyribonuclease subunit B n=1 Tax=Loigolactobacillus zhaoyuanensis TaxID=2486017 RepID=A0ABW8UAB4_9LACO|nr:PD-(D/E)XK nuclease family protein [Loigolactobacillus zhaoyuanensis]
MSLKFVLGPASADRRTALVTQLAQQMDADPQGHFFYVVPNHIKFSSEVDILTAVKQQQNNSDQVFAASRLQIFSFSRLAWYFMKDTPYYQIPRIGTAGLNMLVYQIMADLADQLTIYRGELAQPGFIAQLVKQLLALKVGCVTVADLSRIATELDKQTDLSAKTHDLALIYAAFEQAMQNRYIENTDLLNALSDYLLQQDLSHTYFYIEGFTQLSAQENRLLITLMQKATRLTIGLTLDRPYRQQVPEKQDLFFQPGQLYHQLYQTARGLRVAILADEQVMQLRVVPDLVQLEGFWQQSTNGSRGLHSEKLVTDKSIQIIQSDTRQTEIRQVATKIRQMVALQGYRYQDFLVLTRHLDAYETILAPTFKEFGIPVFDDLQHHMTDHPLVELINALFAVKQHYYRYQDMMRLLKTELLLPQVDGQPMTNRAYRQALDLTENMVLKYGFAGKQWLRKEDWQFYRFDDQDFGTASTKDDDNSAQVNLIRRFVRTTLPPLFKQLDQAENGQVAAQVIYNFLIKQGVVTQLQTWRDRDLEQGELAQAAEPEQTWQIFCTMLDEYVTILGTAPFRAADLLALLQVGFEGASYSQIPSTLDQVLVSETGMVQTTMRKVVFMIGSTDQVMPDRIVSDHLLSDNDQEQLTAHLTEGTYLADDALTQMTSEPFLNYTAFLTARQQLIFTYPLADDGNTLKLSPYVDRIQQHFQITTQISQTRPTITANKIAPFVGSKRSTLTHLIQVSRDAMAQKTQLPPVWLYVYRSLRQDGGYSALTERLLASLNYRNVPQKLRPQIVDALYGKTINTSISKLEEFYQNQYAYFLKYGLKLRERDIFELSPASAGEFYHMALDQLMKRVQAEGQQLNELSIVEVDRLIDSILLNMSTLPQFQILASSNRMAYLARQLAATIKQVAHALQHQSQQTKMAPLRTEVLFGHVGSTDGLAPLRFNLAQGRKVQVRGKIDRIDQMVLGDTRYLGIVDYKSGVHDFNFRDAYYGLALQMLTYLDAMMQNSTLLTKDNTLKTKPAGALYLHLQNPKLKLAEVLSKGFDDALLAKNKYQGFLLNDEPLLENLDHELAERTGSSKIYPLTKIKAGYSAKQSQLVTETELELLLTHDEALIQAAALAIFSGKLDLNPVKWPDNRTALQYSPFKAIMQFDAMLPENSYRQLATLDRAAVLAMLKTEQQAKEDKDEH